VSLLSEQRNSLFETSGSCYMRRGLLSGWGTESCRKRGLESEAISGGAVGMADRSGVLSIKARFTVSRTGETGVL
jgi:hypothetical protein